MIVMTFESIAWTILLIVVFLSFLAGMALWAIEDTETAKAIDHKIAKIIRGDDDDEWEDDVR